jgi:RNA polymerase-binding transcription factor DksA
VSQALDDQAEIVSLHRTLEIRQWALREEIRQELLRSDPESYAELAGVVHIAEEQSVVCEDTGEPIPVERPRVEPAARRTVEAQADYERAHGENTHPSL